MICECVHEQDVLDALAANRWPRRCDEELRAHVAACAICTDLIAVVEPLLHEQEAASTAVRVPPAGVVWWRAQIRARNEAARAVARPIAIVQGAAMIVVLAVVAAVVVTGWARLDGWGQALRSFAGNLLAIEMPLPAFVVQHGVLLALALGTCLVLAPLAVYLAVSDE